MLLGKRKKPEQIADAMETFVNFAGRFEFIDTLDVTNL
jgi:hypothetical protein